MFQTHYLAGTKELQPFYQYTVNDPNFLQIIQDKKFTDLQRKVLAEVLLAQYKNVSNAEKTLQNIEKLLTNNSFTLTTGHQLCLFGGPMFTHYKVMTVINLAEELNDKYTDFQFIPVFWIHTEDHDFAEINHFYTDFIEKKTYKGTFVGAVGRHIITEEIAGVLPENLADNLKNCFAVGRTWAEAYRLYMHELYGKYGLVMLDADDTRLKSFFSPILAAELTENIAQKCITKTNQALEGAGFLPQVQPQPINLFYLDEKGRNRIETADNEIYTLHNRQDISFTKDEILALCKEKPERFSPNVCLRPLYQEIILPNLAYIGGWAEVAYWLQFKSVFEYFNLNFPLVIPRFSATIFREKEAIEWQHYGFSLMEIGKKLPQLWENYTLKNENISVYNEWKNNMLATWQKGEDIFASDSRLTSNMTVQKNKFAKFLQNFYKKYLNALREKNPAPYNHIKTLKLTIQPDNTIQERVLSIVSFSPEIMEVIKKNCKPLDFNHQYLRIND